MSAYSNAGTVLDRILESRRAEVDHRKRVLPETALKYGVKAAPPVRDFAAALTRDALNVLAELKPASRSRISGMRAKMLLSPFFARILSSIPGRSGSPAPTTPTVFF